MLQASHPSDSAWTAADLIDRLGPISLARICHGPIPGCATESDLQTLRDQGNRLYELIDGTLVEKTVGYQESIVAALLISYLQTFVSQHDLGLVSGADGPFRLAADQIRLPDAAFVSWGRLPQRRIPAGNCFEGAADLAIEVISPGNTEQEMESKRREYFAAGSRLVWYVYPKRREVHVFDSPTGVSVLTSTAVLTGGEVLPGFKLPLERLFAGLDEAPE